ncbi:outer membrane beta-barrel protein [Acidipila rosea]|uniref:Opacity protein-like surface antigen n=1 Tax=Acidipila rosea TaxID=768535 RepID=A0A4R1LAE8_9BACT|nr:outer membrane beta-barrel protein [Acidipila rosea]MBW4026983.1 porin family protein [Acidobacteriota bacterium]MBW4045051.1 porin family protein [Acidobacteriota bacterium]TCK75285.1 opacity protein-like surface antigen [Acidipila rosea]
MLKKFLALAVITLSPVLAHSQVATSTTAHMKALWVGGEFSLFNPDYDANVPLTGIGVYADYDLRHKISAEGEARFLGVLRNEDGNETQKDYLIGPRYTPLHWRGFSPYAKLMVGGVSIRYPYNVHTESYFAYAPGGGIDYRIMDRLSVRADYEYQFLPGAPNIPNRPNHGLNPRGFSFGVAYRVW